MEKDGVSLRQLSNGLTVIAMPLHDIETVSVGLLAGAGARLERPGELGGSRVLEHWIWDGLSAGLAELGVYKKSAPNVEWTRFWATTLAPHFAGLLRFILQAASSPGLAEHSFAAYRSLAAHQAAVRENEPQASAADLLRQAMAGDHPAARPAYGQSGHYTHLDPHTVRVVFERLYHPANCVLAVVGNYPARQLEEELDICQERWNGDAALQAASKLTLGPAPQWTPGVAAREREANQVHLALGIPAVPYDDPAFFPVAVLAQIIGGGDGSRLYQELRQRRGLVYQIRSSVTSFRDSGLMTIQLGSRRDSALQALEQIRLELECLERLGVTEAEVQTARNQLIRQMVMRSESTVARMNTLLTSGWYPEYPRSLAAMRQAIEAVTVQRVREVIERFPLSGSFGIASVGPLAESELKAGAVYGGGK
ncbi:pitrilysin family protein [Paenibacillus sp. M1]|uniref:Pitrilysin family protein n=1 Tax=Paenibacillus haidiansis TaxID=1574488 RepID=A0ABU7VWR1_9BACL